MSNQSLFSLCFEKQGVFSFKQISCIDNGDVEGGEIDIAVFIMRRGDQDEIACAIDLLRAAPGELCILPGWPDDRDERVVEAAFGAKRFELFHQTVGRGFTVVI